MPIARLFLSTLVLAVGAFLLSGCMFSYTCLCGKVANEFNVHIVDAAGLPADSVEVTVTRLEDGKKLNAGQANPRIPGAYLVFSDNLLSEFDPASTELRVKAVARKGGRQAAGEYHLRSDPPDCRCHFNEASGPDTLRLP